MDPHTPRSLKLRAAVAPAAGTESLAPHASMFQPVADLLAWADQEMPASPHPALLSDWVQGADSTLEESLRASEVELPAAEEQSFEVVKEIAYGVIAAFMGAARSVGWSAQTVEERQQHVETLLTRPQIPQRTAAWYAQGKDVLTASEFATLFKSPRAVSQLVLSKVQPAVPIDAAATTHRMACLTCEMGPFDWGVRFEPVVKQVLERRWGATVKEAGRLLHPRDSLLAASPDGLITAATDPAHIGRLLEIKCPITRTVGEGIPFEYWCQMQIQMEVTGIGECDYVEVKLASIQKHETALAGDEPPEGHVWLLQNPATCVMSYAYTEQERAAAQAAGWELVETIPWRVDKFYTATVPRDRAWFRGTAAARAAFWASVKEAREGRYQPVESSRPRRQTAAGGAPAPAAGGLTVVVTKEEPACMILDDEPTPVVAPPPEPAPEPTPVPVAAMPTIGGDSVETGAVPA